MAKVDEYRAILGDLDEWDSFLQQESRLPGPRANLELAFAVAASGIKELFIRYSELDEEEAPANTPKEFLAICGVLGLGYLAAGGEAKYLSVLRNRASDPRWRIRESVALGLQEYGRRNMAGLVNEMESWMNGNFYERRAAVAALCEPVLLRDPTWVQPVFDILDEITRSILEEEDRRSDGFKVLRKGLGYCWSVAAAAYPETGKDRMEHWIQQRDKDIHWIMKQNLSKKRMSRMDSKWVDEQLERLKL